MRNAERRFGVHSQSRSLSFRSMKLSTIVIFVSELSCEHGARCEVLRVRDALVEIAGDVGH